MTKCSIVIRCYNEEFHIDKLLQGIFKQTLTDIEVILVDSGSTDRTVEIASGYPIKLVSIRPEDFSFGRAINIGCKEAKGEFIVFASAHVYPVYCDWLDNLLRPFADPDVAVAYGKQQGNEVTKYSEHQVFATWFPDVSHCDRVSPFSNNANAAIRRDLWKSFPYDEELTGLEDLDWAKRIQQEGYKVAYAADAPIVHVHDESPQRIQNRYRREAIALKRICPEEHFHFVDFVCLFVGNLVSDYYHAWHDRVLWQNLGEIFVFRLMQFWGTYQGFRQQGQVSSQLKQRFYYPKELVRPQRSRKVEANRSIDYVERPLTEVLGVSSD